MFYLFMINDLNVCDVLQFICNNVINSIYLCFETIVSSVNKDTVHLMFAFVIFLVSLISSLAIWAFSSSESPMSFVPLCKITSSGFLSSSGTIWWLMSAIFALLKLCTFTSILPDSLHPWTFLTIESPAMITLGLRFDSLLNLFFCFLSLAGAFRNSLSGNLSPGSLLWDFSMIAVSAGCWFRIENLLKSGVWISTGRGVAKLIGPPLCLFLCTCHPSWVSLSF